MSEERHEDERRRWNASEVESPTPGRVFEVRAESVKGDVRGFGARATRGEGESLLSERVRQYDGAPGWRRWWLEEVDTTGLWQPPRGPAPRERYRTRVTELPRQSGTWTGVHVEVLDRERVVAEYDRNYSMLDTFEPFRQGDRHFALISPHYTGTSVLDLATGKIIAAEPQSSVGFCPVGFYVPDWCDLHDPTTLFPGTLTWRPLDDNWPTGDFGFVWGCIWGDDSSWKVQHLDLSRVSEGVIARDDRFGYVRLATHPKLGVLEVIRCSSWQGQRRVTFRVERDFDIGTGHLIPDDEV